VTTRRPHWVLAGVLAGLAGLATSYATAMVLSIRESPVVAVAEQVIDLAPGAAAERAIALLGHYDKPALVVGILVLLLGCFALAGALARRSWWLPVLVWVALAGVGLAAVMAQRGAAVVDVLPVVVGLVTWVFVHSALTDALHREQDRPDLQSRERRVFLVVAGVVSAAAVGIAVAGRFVGAGRRHVEESRRLLRIPGVTRREAPPATSVGLRGVAPWQTPNEDFYRIDTALSTPQVDVGAWELAITGLVARPFTVTYDELVEMATTEDTVTLSCVSNEVGGNLVGNAVWQGVPLAVLLERAGVREGATQIVGRSVDDFTAGFPTAIGLDGRTALVAVGMNGEPLPAAHGFPARLVVAGLYGYVSATKWLREIELTTWEDFDGYWVPRGWSKEGPIKTMSRIDVPRSGASLGAGAQAIAGVAWAPPRGIEKVEVQVDDGGPWVEADLGDATSGNTWVQWKLAWDATPGEHAIRVRATGADGITQTEDAAPPAPDGATGWHRRTVKVS
jgi:DMSO/TMAO reductase YedYZ molybdopterin-dependent catalytic subunit